MKYTDKDIKRIICTLLEDNIDAVMQKSGFSRRKNGLIYSKSIGTVRQKIEMIYFVHPQYQTDALAHIYPWLSVYYPEVNELAAEILGENALLSGLKGKTLRQPIQIYTKSERWILQEEKQLRRLADGISRFLKEYTLPVLCELETSAGYIDMYESCDKRLIWDDRQHIYLACAYALNGEYQKGFKVLEKRFGNPGLRKQYQKIFAWFEGRENLKP